jgi:hypothetical protein
MPTLPQWLAIASAVSLLVGAIAPVLPAGSMARKIADAIAHMLPGNLVGAVRAFTSPSGTPAAAGSAEKVVS